MRHTLKHVMQVGLLFLLIFGMTTAVSAQDIDLAQEPAPTLVGGSDQPSISGKAGNGNDETPGEWYAGDEPENPVSNAPVLLFVPGLNNVAQVFWEDNDMYQTARDAGYQTAFLQLHDAGGASADMWDNGELLADKVKEISEHFDDRKVTIIAYSKGGVDTQTALTYYGASDYVDNVVTLSSPHHGSQLADLAYSSWAGWLADLIGAKGDGTYSMQMANMEEFRSQTDSEPLAYAANYYTIGGTDWGSVFSSNWFGGTYLSQFGPNDGVVTAESSALPGGQELAIGDWNHTTVRTGETFPVFESYLMGQQSFGLNDSPGESANEQIDPSFSQWVHGGELFHDQENNTNILVEDHVNTLEVQVLTSDPLEDIELIDTNGNKVYPEIKRHQHVEGVFAGAHSYTLSLNEPEAGEWTLNTDIKEDGAYLVVADYDKQTDVLKGSAAQEHTKRQFNYQLEMNDSAIQTDSLQITYKITQSDDPSNRQTYHSSGKTSPSQLFSVKNSGEVYNITIDIEGLTTEGDPFTRTVIDSVYIDE